MVSKIKLLMFFAIVLFLAFPVKASATVYTRNTGVVTITAPKSKKYQWYVKKNKRWKKIKGENRRKITLLCNKKMNGYRYRCKLAKKYSKSEKLIITDIGKRYQRSISKEEIKGLFMPKCADGYCYVHCTSKLLVNQTRQSLDIINKNIGRTFIYTDSPHIADIIIEKWTKENMLNDSIWLKDNEIDQIRNNGYFWAGVTFSMESIHYLVCINLNYVYGRDDICKSVIIHELGHCIGLGHSTNRTSIMYETCLGVTKMSKLDIINFKKQKMLIKALQK